MKIFAVVVLIFFLLLSTSNQIGIASPPTTPALSSTSNYDQTAAVTGSGSVPVIHTPTVSPTEAIELPMPPSTTLAPSLTLAPSFGQVYPLLVTPQILEAFMHENFSFREHRGCYSYPPDIFLRLRKGNCKDYATFISSVLEKNGYETQIVTFTWYTTTGIKNGHVDVIFRDQDGRLKYFSNDSLIGQVDSVEDLLIKEKNRFGAGKIGVHYLLQPGSLNLCHP